MTRLADVNTRDIRGAIELGCQTMSSVFNADDSDVDCPFFDVEVRPDVKMGFSGLHTEAHVPGRHINAMLNAEDAAGVVLDEAAVDAVRQWEYTPTLLNGVPVPVIMTVTVNFQLR